MNCCADKGDDLVEGVSGNYDKDSDSRSLDEYVLPNDDIRRYWSAHVESAYWDIRKSGDGNDIIDFENDLGVKAYDDIIDKKGLKERHILNHVFIENLDDLRKWKREHDEIINELNKNKHYRKVEWMLDNIYNKTVSAVRSNKTLFRNTSIQEFKELVKSGFDAGAGRNWKTYGKHDFISTTIHPKSLGHPNEGFNGNCLIVFDTAEMEEGKDWKVIKYEMRPNVELITDTVRTRPYENYDDSTQTVAFANETEVHIHKGAKVKVSAVMFRNVNVNVRYELIRLCKDNNIKVSFLKGTSW